MAEIIHLYHINDLHSQFDRWPRIKRFIKERERLHSQVREETIIFDLGDHMDRCHPYTEGLLGKGNVHMLNELGCRFATIGNNEGITFPFEVLDSLYDDAEFEVLVSNLYYLDGTRPTWAVDHKIYTTEKGTRIAFLGATAYFRIFYESLGWKVTEPVEEIKRVVDGVKEQCDAIVLLSHLGIDTDEKIAYELPDIDVILGAHTHHILHEGKQVNKTLLCGAGKAGMYVGHVEIMLDDQHIPVRAVARLNDMNEENSVYGEAEQRSLLLERGKELLNDHVCAIPHDLVIDWFAPSVLPQLLCDELRVYCDADCAFLNAGLLLGGLSEGIVKKYDIHRICPHPINPCTVELSGRELKEVLIQSQNEEWPHMQVKGFGFRGKVLGNMVYSQVEFGENRNIKVNGAELDPDKMYKLALPDMFTFGFFFPLIKRSERKHYFLPEFLRDLLAARLAKLYPCLE
ncbi:MAG: bifunctional metallophosphatase/5'-nucleotidase [Bacillus sp. (in: firmicutes)]